jgi:hypothetical protein
MRRIEPSQAGMVVPTRGFDKTEPLEGVGEYVVVIEEGRAEY